MMKLDSAVLKVLALDPSKTTVSVHGGGGMSSASKYKVTALLNDGKSKSFFMKTGEGEDAKIMFEGEHASLSALHNADTTLCPTSFGWGRLADSPSKYFIVTDFLYLSPGRISAASSVAASLATKLAKLHNTSAPIPKGYSKPMFGFPTTTCCGDTPQPNDYRESWADFYGEQRLGFISKRCRKRNHADVRLDTLINATIDRVVPRLLGDRHLGNSKGIVPVVVHGDLWSGNAGRGKIGSDEGEAQEVVFDPSACYAHNEYDVGIMKMFGGFDPSFFEAYHKLCPKTEPVEEYKDRLLLYELYHHLNHYALFGGGYRGGAVNIMKNLVRKYESDGNTTGE